MKKVCLINVVGLTSRLLAHAPKLNALAKQGFSAPMQGVIPAVTCSAQATMLTGLSPQEHGIVGNGWFFRELGETRFWVQSNALIIKEGQGEKLYETARKLAEKRGEKFSCAKLFWWYNQGAAVDFSVTPKPHYGADGSKEFGISSQPPELSQSLEKTLGAFPFFSFWGPRAGLLSSEWIARAAVEVMEKHSPTLTLVYLPHLDYDLQRFGPEHPDTTKRVQEVDECAALVAEAAKKQGAEVVIVSEYGLSPVQKPIHLNRVLREAGWLQVRPGPFGEMLDVFSSKAFAVADHQLAHVYVTDPKILPAVKEKLKTTPGVAAVYEGKERAQIQLDHPRSGELIVLAKPDSWFSYYYWLDDSQAPDFARTVDIHRKPGYDPCELFVDPKISLAGAKIAWKLAKKKLGLRYLMDVIPLDASLVKGSHGLHADPQDGPIFISSSRQDSADRIKMTEVKERVLKLLEL